MKLEMLSRSTNTDWIQEGEKTTFEDICRVPFDTKSCCFNLINARHIVFIEVPARGLLNLLALDLSIFWK